MKKLNIPVIAAIIVGSILIGGSIIYSSQASINGFDDQISIIGDDGKTYTSEKEDPITLTIINDASCEECETEEIIAMLKKQFGTSVALRNVEVSSNEGSELVTKYDIQYIPFILVGNEIAEASNIGHLTHHILSETDDRYYADFEKMGGGIGRYLDIKYYSKDDPEAPKAEIAVSEYDFGDVSVQNGITQTEFLIKNTGKSPLELLNFNTSCGCTSGLIKLKNEESPIFKMAGHGDPMEWKGSIEAGEEATVVVYYDPTVHPDLAGEVTRSVIIGTNDPNNSELTFKINVNQTL